MIILAIVITWVILAILFIVSDEFDIPQLAYIIAFPVYIVAFPVVKGCQAIYHSHIRNNYGCYEFDKRTFILNYKLAKQFNPNKVKLHRAGKDFRSFPHKQELIDSLDELREMGYTDKFIDEMKN